MEGMTLGSPNSGSGACRRPTSLTAIAFLPGPFGLRQHGGIAPGWQLLLVRAPLTNASDNWRGTAVRKVIYGLLLLILALGLGFLLGPREPVDTNVTFDPAKIGNEPDAYLARSEAQLAGIRDGLQKEIIWAFPNSKAKTKLAIVYIHGFSASKGEIRPVPDKVAAALGANLFYTRLTGHGQNGQAMAVATVNDWVNDYAEALAIGRMIGEKVIIIATSTGAGLSTWAATRPELSKDVAAMIFVSPNYGVQASGSFLLTMPWGRQLANLIIGPERAFTPVNELHGKYWTPKYPTNAVLPMAAQTKLARDSRVEDIRIPTLFIFAETDKVVRPDLTKERIARWGAKTETLIVEKPDDPYQHVVAGDALSPNKTEEAAAKMTAFIQSLGL
jgi:pimeloyl-ACP methyl ester carboxylesterase